MDRREFVRFSSLSSSLPWLSRLTALFRSPQSMANETVPPAPGSIYHVAVNGNDRNSGTPERPFATLSRARDALRRLPRGSSTPRRVLVHAGTYYLPEPLILGPQDSGTSGAPVNYAAVPGETVTLSGGRRINAPWHPYRNGILQCELPEVKSGLLYFTQLFVNGRRQIRARYPNYDPHNPLVSGSGYISTAGSIPPDVPDPHPDPDQGMTFTGDAPRGILFNPQTFTSKSWARPAEAVIHIFQAYSWGNLQWQLKSVDGANHHIWFGQGGWQIGAKWSRNPCAVNQHSRFYIENVFEELDAPGEWYLDQKAGVLYYMPEEGVDMRSARVEAPVLEEVVRMEGTEEEPVHDVVFKGFRLAHTRSTFLEKYETPSLSDWSIHRGGTVWMEGARGCRVEDCWFDAVGGNGAFLNRYNRGNVVAGCKFTESGDSAICLVGALETTNGTRRDFPYECQATNNLIHDCGMFGKQIAGVYISRAKRITAGHNLIYNLPRAGICIGDGTWGGHVIEFNHIHHTVRETQDHGPFNSWGRTVEWCLVHSHDSKLTSPHGAGNVRAFVQETIIVRNNLLDGVADYRPGEFLHALDLDDGSSNYHLYNNVCVGMAISIRDGAYRTVENNIIINPRVPVGFHVGYDKNHDVFRHNIICTTGDIYFLNWPPPTEPWLQEIDHNLFFNPETPWLYTPVITVGSRSGEEKKFTLEQWQARGYDAHSMVGNPLFVDPAAKDYRVKDASPALKLGFENFEMGRFGLTSDFPDHLLD